MRLYGNIFLETSFREGENTHSLIAKHGNANRSNKMIWSAPKVPGWEPYILPWVIPIRQQHRWLVGSDISDKWRPWPAATSETNQRRTRWAVYVLCALLLLFCCFQSAAARKMLENVTLQMFSLGCVGSVRLDYNSFWVQTFNGLLRYGFQQNQKIIIIKKIECSAPSRST